MIAAPTRMWWKAGICTNFATPFTTGVYGEFPEIPSERLPTWALTNSGIYGESPEHRDVSSQAQVFK